MDPLETARQRVTDLLARTGAAHHQAFAATDGEDPEWAIWYANHLREPLNEILGIELTASRIVYCLLSAENERIARGKDEKWAPFYAEHFAQCFSSSEAPTRDRLQLYEFGRCPFCRRVRETIDRLRIDVERRDIHDDRDHWNDLVAARGRATVPVLRIDSGDGNVRWMPESADIVRYLEKTYG